MPRLNVINPASSTGKVREMFDGPLKGLHKNLFKGLANSPAALQTYLAISGALKSASLTPAEQEAIALAISEASGCDYCTAAHTTIGKMAGLTESQTIAARKGALPDNPRIDALVRFALKLHETKGQVSDEDLKRFRAAGFNDGHIAEVVACYALNIFTNYFNHVNKSDVDFPAAPPLK